MPNLEGKVFVVIGGTGGIGWPIVLWLHNHGANVAAAARNERKLDSCRYQLDDERILYLKTDASEPGSTAKLLRAASSYFRHPISCVIVSVGEWEISWLNDGSSKAKHMLEKLVGTIGIPSFVATYESFEFLQKQGSGLVVNMSSHVCSKDERKLPGNVAYRLAKQLAENFVDSARSSFEKAGVRAVNLRPSLVDTPGNRKKYPSIKNWSEAVQPNDLAKWIAKATIGNMKFREPVEFKGELRV